MIDSTLTARLAEGNCTYINPSQMGEVLETTGDKLKRARNQLEIAREFLAEADNDDLCSAVDYLADCIMSLIEAVEAQNGEEK